jgi:hypothetical protein
MKKLLTLFAVVFMLSGQGENWTILSPGGTPPSVRWGSASVYDSIADRFIVFGGAIWGQAYNNLYALDSTTAGNGVWRQLTPTGTLPTVRGFCAPVYDAPRRRLIVFGGYNMAGGCDSRVYFLDSVYTNAPRWSQPAISGSPPAVRQSTAAAYDPIQERVIVFSGWCGYAWRNDIYVIENLDSTPTWRRLYPAGSGPGGRWGACAVYDPGRDVFYVFGGQNSSQTYPNTVYALDSLQAGDGRWRQLTISGTPPNGRMWHVAAYDAPRDRMLIFSGGYFQSSTFNDLRSVESLSTSPAWTTINAPGTKPTVRYGMSSALDGAGNRLILFGGNSGGASGTNYNDVYTLTLSSEVSENPNSGFALPEFKVLPNPSHQGVTITYLNRQRNTLSFAIYDAMGKLVKTCAYSNEQPRIRVVWNGMDERGSDVPSGIYFAIVETATGIAFRQFVKIK